jgi:hypothetical protein
LQVRDRLTGILGQPVGHAQMIVRRREFRVQLKCACKTVEGFGAAVEDRQEKAYFVLHTCRCGVSSFGLLPNREGSGNVAAGLSRGGFSFHVAKRGLLLRGNSSSHHQAGEGRPI